MLLCCFWCALSKNIKINNHKFDNYSYAHDSGQVTSKSSIQKVQCLFQLQTLTPSNSNDIIALPIFFCWISDSICFLFIKCSAQVVWRGKPGAAGEQIEEDRVSEPEVLLRGAFRPQCVCFSDQ